ncbi:MAG: SMC-Scp complex subunit ScpB [Chitinispirillia bacterium]|nr:SMC-Scp complex subunit ScpB [Chitinispirillia bacterium]MCL2269237.1 SMC-Scp complex subunit ScpB [Chitinispirillia bacterium]
MTEISEDNGVEDNAGVNGGVDGDAVSEPDVIDELEDTGGPEESDAPDEPPDNGADDLRILEALLFASEELLTPARLKALIPGAPDVRRLRKMVGELNEQLVRERHPFEIVEAGGGYQFRTISYYHPWVRKLYKERAAKKLSLKALECLAIVAYNQPISKAEIEAVRGVLSDGVMNTLLEKKLIDFCGRSEKPGRPWLYGTTNDFLRYFGLNKIGDLPRLEDFEPLARARMEEFATEELMEQQEGQVHDDGDDVNE